MEKEKHQVVSYLQSKYDKATDEEREIIKWFACDWGVDLYAL